MKTHPSRLQRLVVVTLSSTLAGVGPGGAADAQPAAAAWVLDSEARSLVALELPSGKRVGTLALPGTPSFLLQNPDGSRLVVLDRGPGEDKGERGYKATGRSSATVVDSAALAVVGRVELGFGVAPRQALFSPDSGRLALLCPGYEAKNAAESLARELVSVDLATGREAGRLALEPGAWPIEASGSHFYLMDRGKADDNPKKNRNGLVRIASVEAGAIVATVDAGREPRGLYPDEAGRQVYVPADGPPGSSEGELRVLRGAELAATLKVAANPRLVVRERDVVFVVGEKAVTLVDPVSLETTATIPLARGTAGLVDDGDLPTDLKVSPDGKRAFAHYGLHHKVATLDLESKTATGSTKTGRGGKKFLGNMMGGMFGAVGMLAAGYSLWIHTAPSMLAVRPDGRFAYAINNQTKDITVVDGATGQSVEMIGGNGYALELLKDGRFLFEVSESELRLVDMERNLKTAEIPLPDLRGLFFTRERSLAVALAKGTALVLDGTSGKELARLTDFASPVAIAFAPQVEAPSTP